MYIMFINRVFPTGGMEGVPRPAKNSLFSYPSPPLSPPPPPFDFYFLPIKSRFPPH